MVKHVDAACLASRLCTDAASVVVLDTRDSDEFASGYIDTAINVFASGLALRRLRKGCMGLDSLICEAGEKAKYQMAKESENMLVVIYDEDTLSYDNLNEDCLTHILLRRVTRDCKNVAFLEGGFKTFARVERKMCCWQDKPASPSKSVRSAPKLLSRPSSLSLQLKRLSMEDSAEEVPATPFSADRPSRCPVEILPHLYLGDIQCARDRNVLKTNEITRILNVSQLPNSFEEDNEIVYKSIPVEDAAHVNLSAHFTDAFQFIETSRENDKKVLVHCQAGISRSVTVILAYLIQHMSYSLEQAYDFVKSKKSNIQPNFSFMGQLLDFERSKSPDSGIEISPLDDNIENPLS